MKRTIILLTIGLGAVSAQTLTPSELIRQRHAAAQASVPASHRVSRHPVRAVRPVAHVRTPKTHRVHREPRRAHGTPVQRRFRSLKEYQQLRRKRIAHTHRSTVGTRPAVTRHGRYVGNGWYVDEHGQYDEQYTQTTRHYTAVPRRYTPQRGYRYYRRWWYVRYRDTRAAFVDRHGYYYGYFNTRGFYFDGVFYRYDRAYTYQDRLHGKGLFEHRFYRPMRRWRRARTETIRWPGSDGRFELQLSWMR